MLRMTELDCSSYDSRCAAGAHGSSHCDSITLICPYNNHMSVVVQRFNSLLLLDSFLVADLFSPAWRSFHNFWNPGTNVLGSEKKQNKIIIIIIVNSNNNVTTLHVPRSLHKTIDERAFPVAAVRAWNMLPPAITSLPSLQTFKRAQDGTVSQIVYDNAH